MIGVIPAAGSATRMFKIPKFLLPVPGGTFLFDTLCSRMREASPNLPIVTGVTAENVQALQNFVPSNVRMTHVETKTMSETVLALQPHCGTDSVLFGMPDTYWTAPHVFLRLRDELRDGADVAVALWRIHPPQWGKVGQCELDDNGRVVRVSDKDPLCNFEWVWGALAWESDFWQFIRPEMPHVGYALQGAIDAGLSVEGVCFNDEYFDCGTPDAYFHCVRSTM